MLPPSKPVSAGKLTVTPLAVMPPNSAICANGNVAPGLSVTYAFGPPIRSGTQFVPPLLATKVTAWAPETVRRFLKSIKLLVPSACTVSVHPPTMLAKFVASTWPPAKAWMFMPLPQYSTVIFVNPRKSNSLLGPTTVQDGIPQPVLQLCSAGNVTTAPPLSDTLPPSKPVSAGRLTVTPLAVMPPNCVICATGNVAPGLRVTYAFGPPIRSGTQFVPPLLATKVTA